jgi:magnesium chelatase family protein
MRTVCTWTAALTGTEGHLAAVEADISPGQPATVLTGLPDTALREARDRVRAAIINSGEHWPATKITVGLYPARLPKRGSAFDLAIAIAVMAANGDLPPLPDNLLFLAELGLDGRLRPVPGVLPAVLAGAASGLEVAVVAPANYGEAAQAPGITVIAADTLADVTAWLRGGPPPPHPAPDPADGGTPAPAAPQPDLAGIAGQAAARFALEVCAAGGHSLSLLGPGWAGAAMLAERLPGIMPALDAEAALEVTVIRSVAGMLAAGSVPVTVPPYCAPHRTSSLASMLGGGSGLIRPGWASLAHRGVLFLDQAPEFPRAVLDALRQPMETGKVEIARGGIHAVFPARFILVLASAPCPCEADGKLGRADCACSPAARRRYLARLSGPLADQVDVKIRLQSPARGEVLRGRKSAEPSAVVARRVAAARERATVRLAGMPWRVNAEVPGAALRTSFPAQYGALAALDRALELGRVSARRADKIIGVAWTLADLAGKDQPGREETDRALRLSTGTARPAEGIHS